MDKKYKKRTKLPTSGMDPIFYHIFQDTLPPEQCYRMVPTLKDLVVDDPTVMKKKGYKKR
jgi:hypothetical protein